MEPTTRQFEKKQSVYFKGENQKNLELHAEKQNREEKDITRKMTPAQEYDRDVKSGVQGAKNIVNLNPTVKEVMDNPSTMGGPVSGAALAKLKAKKSAAKATKEKEMKRR
jgi:hypothetical protein